MGAGGHADRDAAHHNPWIECRPIAWAQEMMQSQLLRAARERWRRNKPPRWISIVTILMLLGFVVMFIR